MEKVWMMSDIVNLPKEAPNPAHRKDGFVLCLTQSQPLKHSMVLQSVFNCHIFCGYA
jgi:hypothetical protein